MAVRSRALQTAAHHVIRRAAVLFADVVYHAAAPHHPLIAPVPIGKARLQDTARRPRARLCRRRLCSLLRRYRRRRYRRRRYRRRRRRSRHHRQGWMASFVAEVDADAVGPTWLVAAVIAPFAFDVPQRAAATRVVAAEGTWLVSLVPFARCVQQRRMKPRPAARLQVCMTARTACRRNGWHAASRRRL